MNKELKQAFEKWYLYTYLDESNQDDLIIHIGYDLIKCFEEQNLSEQFGVYQDFYDGVGIQIDIISFNDYFYDVNGIHSKQFETRPQAREQALKKAAEIWEEQQK